MPVFAVVLIVIFSILILAILLLWLIPSLRPKHIDETEEEIADNEVKSIIVSEEENPLQKEAREDRYKAIIARKEKELGFYFTDDDIDALLVQMKQDEKDGF